MSSTKAATATEWLLPQENSPIERIATATYNGAGIPVPIEDMLRNVLTVTEAEWPFEVDALMIWHQGVPSKVLVRKRAPAYARRLRMTFAHELGHVVIPWHVGYGMESCDADVDDQPGGDYVRHQENEARSFAGRLLLPQVELEGTAADRDLRGFFGELDRFEASAWASAWRLKEVMRPGFVFAGNFRDYHTTDLLHTNGTRSLSVQEARSAAVDSGHFLVGGRSIQWFQLARAEVFQPNAHPRRPSEIIRAILEDVRADATVEQRTAEFQSIQGVLGSALGRGPFSNAVTC